MNHSEPDPGITHSTNPMRITPRFCLVRTVVALAFLIIAAGITTAEWLESDGDAAGVRTAQRP